MYRTFNEEILVLFSSAFLIAFYHFKLLKQPLTYLNVRTYSILKGRERTFHSSGVELTIGGGNRLPKNN